MPEWLAAEQSNSTIVLGEEVVVKLLRRLQPGIHPEAEVTRYLCGLGYRNVPPFMGEARRVEADGTSYTLMLAQGFVRNQGDGWRWDHRRPGTRRHRHARAARGRQSGAALRAVLRATGHAPR